MLLITRDLNAKVRGDITRKEDVVEPLTTSENNLLNFVSTIASEQWSGKIKQNLDFMAVVE